MHEEVNEWIIRYENISSRHKCSNTMGEVIMAILK
jgi:hypothetical protein